MHNIRPLPDLRKGLGPSLMGCIFSKASGPELPAVPLLDTGRNGQEKARDHAASTDRIRSSEVLGAGTESQPETDAGVRVCGCLAASSLKGASTSSISSKLGVTAPFLHHFLAEHTFSGMKTWQLKEAFTLTATASRKSPLVECLNPTYVDKATVFVSHAYSYDLRDSIEVMLRHAKRNPGKVYWFDPFSLNQHPVPGKGTVPTDQLIAAFGDRILEFESTLIVASPWNNPAFLNRAWYCVLCVFFIFVPLPVSSFLPQCFSSYPISGACLNSCAATTQKRQSKSCCREPKKSSLWRTWRLIPMRCSRR